MLFLALIIVCLCAFFITVPYYLYKKNATLTKYRTNIFIKYMLKEKACYDTMPKDQLESEFKVLRTVWGAPLILLIIIYISKAQLSMNILVIFFGGLTCFSYRLLCNYYSWIKIHPDNHKKWLSIFLISIIPLMFIISTSLFIILLMWDLNHNKYVILKLGPVFTAICIYLVFLVSNLIAWMKIISVLVNFIKTKLSYIVAIVYIVIIYSGNLMFSSVNFALLNPDVTPYYNNWLSDDIIILAIDQMDKNFNFPQKKKYVELENIINDRNIKSLLNDGDLNQLQKNLEKTSFGDLKSTTLEILSNVSVDLTGEIKKNNLIMGTKKLDKYANDNMIKLDSTIIRDNNFKEQLQQLQQVVEEYSKLELTPNNGILNTDTKKLKLEKEHEILNLLISILNILFDAKKSKAPYLVGISDTVFFYCSVGQYIVKNIIDWILLGLLAAIIFEAIKPVPNKAIENKEAKVNNFKNYICAIKNYLIEYIAKENKMRNIKKLFKFIKYRMTFAWYRLVTVKKNLLILFAITSISVLLRDFWLIHKTEWFPKAATVGDIYYKLCLSFIAAFIFYFINIHLPAEKLKVKMFRYISNKTSQICNLETGLIVSIQIYSNIDRSAFNDVYSLLEQETDECCKIINPNDQFMLYTHIKIPFNNWFEGFNYIYHESKKTIDDLLQIKECLDSNYLEILTTIEDCLGKINLSKGGSLANTNLEFYSNDIKEYTRLCDKLSKYKRKNYIYYEREYHDNFVKSHKK